MQLQFYKKQFDNGRYIRSKLKLTDKGEEALKEAITIVPEDIEYVYIEMDLEVIFI